ncbi:MAG TPA: macro domain-containing protein [Epulopiscium sp.]|nr:macro domain-containing protein [Candidatus Epulonipiscium sp.]
MPFKIIRNDISKMKTQAIVNAANTNLQMGGGVCGAIFTAAGKRELQRECDALKPCQVGRAVITSGHKLLAKYIIHTVGPIWQGGNQNEAKLLASAYQSALDLALENNIESIAFPLISTGIYAYPRAEALKIATSVIQAFLLEHEMDISLVVYEKEAVTLSEKLFEKIEKYIDDHYIREERGRVIESYDRYGYDQMPCASMAETCENSLYKKRSLEDVMGQIEETFSQRLLGLIDEKGMTDVQAYKNANVDRRLFSKIRSDDGYKPSKITAIAFAIALKLNLDEANDLLARAGYVLSPSSEFDLIIRFFIEEKNYDMYEINQTLFRFDHKPLGCPFPSDQ